MMSEKVNLPTATKDKKEAVVIDEGMRPFSKHFRFGATLVNTLFGDALASIFTSPLSAMNLKTPF